MKLGKACMVLAAVATFGWPTVAEATPFVFQLEGGTVLKKDTYQVPTWDTVTLKYTYENPVILAIPNTNGGNPADFRIRNITQTDFELTLAEPASEDGPHIAMTISYVAVETGKWQLPDNQQIAAGFASVTNVVHKGGGSWVTVPLPSGFASPIVLAQIEGLANEQNSLPSQISNPWMTAAVRNVTASSFQLALDGCECNLSGSLAQPETVGWMAIEGGLVGQFIDSDSLNILYETIHTGNSVTGWDNGGTFVSFSQSYSSTPLFIAQMLTRNEDDGGWLRYSALGTGGVSLRVDEDRCQDNERSHAGEQAGLFVFSQGFRVQDADPDKDGISSGLDNCPLTFNPNQSDVDNDGQGDACDCGDALVFSGEGCDDGGTSGGDGCSASCQVEPGWSCSGSPSVCTPICGDGKLVGGEGCDDGGQAGGDGCSASCQVEPGWSCTGEPSQCTPVCGDGMIVDGEGCDDGDSSGGDGCSASCQVEAGWSCSGEPSQCVTICGDGIIAGSEACDDGGSTGGDGCSASCQVEAGWGCSGEPSQCATICGDGMIIGSEGCDDGGSSGGDGCSASCQVEAGWSCGGEPSQCATICGDGLIAGSEGCDDSGTSGGDGCSASCAIEPGWSCTGEPSVCTPGCGDGILAGSEACDDGGATDGDGCSASCQVEAGWSCSGEPSVCDPICGDNLIVGTEECDDGNTLDGDGCSADCKNEGGTGGAGGIGGAGGGGAAGGSGGTAGAGGSGGSHATGGGLADDLKISGRGCACRLGSRGEGGSGASLFLLVGLALLRRRERAQRGRARRL